MDDAKDQSSDAIQLEMKQMDWITKSKQDALKAKEDHDKSEKDHQAEKSNLLKRFVDEQSLYQKTK